MNFPPQRIKSALFLGWLVVVPLMGAEPSVSAEIVISLDARDPGRIYDGIGALSAGASSRLLIDYPEPQRTEILDYLFKPNFGAALQINKVEIGGDMNSTDGSEPSHMRTPDDHNYQRGYEWWLMEESKKRNPSVKLFGLEWGAPGWINPVKNDVWTKENIAYLIDWVTHAKSDHGLTIDYFGGWNERDGNPDWFVELRKALDQAGLKNLQIVADDAFKWKAGSVMAAHPDYAASAAIIGTHYPEKITGPDFAANWSESLKTGKPLWGSEIGSAHYNGGAVILARLYNRGYIEQKITSFINWSTIWSVLPGLPYSGDGLMLADQPWSGAYEVGLSIWATAHTSQFAQPGWQYLDGACGYFVPNDHKAGSHVVLRSPDQKDFSLIAETVDAKDPVTASFAITGGLKQAPLHVWKTKMEKTKPDGWFLKQADILPDKAGHFTLTFDPGCLYSLTTTEGQSKGETTPPARSPLRLPYKESFQTTGIGRTPRYFSDQHGTFETAPAKGGGQCLRQVVTLKPVYWNSDADPSTLIGDPSWRDYTVKSEVLLEQPGYVELLGRVSGTKEQNLVPGYHLRLSDGTHWTLFYRTSAKKPEDIELASGELSAPAGTGQWHTLGLSFQGDHVSASIDGHAVVHDLADHHSDEALARKAIPCFTGFATSRWENGEFRKFEVTENK
jgi:hypothetical protein